MSLLLILGNDGGNYDVSKNDIAVDFSLYTEIITSLFGGNIEASTEREKPLPIEVSEDWFGNIYDINKPTNQLNSEFERALINIPATSAGLIQYESAGKRDLQWIIDRGLASEVSIEASIVEAGKVKIDISIDGDDQFSVVWDQTRLTIEELS